jgi:DNA-binding MarR family transcriptional regulator
MTKSAALRQRTDGTEAAQPAMDLDRFVPYLLNRIANRLNLDLLEALRPLGVTQARWRVLAVLMARDGRSMTELSVYCVIEQSSLSRVVDQMERDGLAERRARPGDSRVTEVFITDHGRRIFETVQPVALQQAERALAGFSPEEAARFTGYLHRILGNVRRSEFP